RCVRLPPNVGADVEHLLVRCAPTLVGVHRALRVDVNRATALFFGRGRARAIAEPARGDRGVWRLNTLTQVGPVAWWTVVVALALRVQVMRVANRNLFVG